MLKKNSSDKISIAKNAFFFRELQLISFAFNLQFLRELKHKVDLFKTVLGIFHFQLCLVFIKVFIFVQQKPLTL